MLVARCGALVLPARPVATVGRVLLRSRPIVLEAAEPQATDLPEGWAAAKDDEGSTYYWNKETKETTWQRPGAAPKADAAGNVYDDESEQDDGPQFSDAMRQKMINESRGLGGDPNQKNPFLLVFAGIGLFVLAGAISSGSF